MITGLNHITLAVTDIERSFNFYRDLLGFKPLCRWHKGAYFLVGETWFCLNLDLNRKESIIKDYTHFAFSVAACEFAKLSDKIISAGCPIFKENNSEGDSVYFLDPDNHKLEIHVGNWQSRICSKRSDPGSWQNVEFFVE